MGTPRTAALYMRMSTEKQDYSIRHQRYALEIFAAAHEIVVVREYLDEGKSGLALKGRAGLRHLLDDVISTDVPFDTVLVYDVSRWGRFQDVDEAAHYEFLCRSAGITVLYCAEQFQNDGSPLSSMVKTIKRAMAAEYSRELSDKVFKAQCRFTKLGFKQGGSAGFGLRRLSVSDDGHIRGVLESGERKRFPTDRVIFAQGPEQEVAVVRQIYRWYVRDKLSCEEIARTLNKRGIRNEWNKLWTRDTVKSVLSNEKYVGNLVFNRKSSKLGIKRVANGPHLHVRKEGVFSGIVSSSLFSAAQRESERRLHHWTNEELLEHLRVIHEKHGKLTADLINAELGPSDKLYRSRFRTLANAFAQAGADDSKYTLMAQTKVAMSKTYEDFIHRSIELAQLAGANVIRPSRWPALHINEVRVRLVVCRRKYPKEVIPRWRVVLRYSGKPDFLLIAQMDPSNAFILSYFLLPMSECTKTHVWLRNEPWTRYFKYRYLTLEDIFGVCAWQPRSAVRERQGEPVEL